MNNKRIKRYIALQVIRFSLSFLIAWSIVWLIKVSFTGLFLTSNQFIIRRLANIFYDLSYSGSKAVEITSIFIFTIIIYEIICYKEICRLYKVIEDTKKMAEEDSINKIYCKNDDDDDIELLAKNINCIITKLQQKTEDERLAQQMKNDLITNVSHDLRTPLTSIIGYLNLISEDKYKDEVELRYYIDIAYDKAKLLNVLITDLFDLTKMQNGNIQFIKSKIDLVELLNQLISGMIYEFKSEDMEWRTFFSEEKLIIKADPHEIARVFLNLINNSLRYGKDGHFIDLKTYREKDNAVVEVINYGEEIPSTDLPYIFDRFYRAEKSRNRERGGSGLGLAISKSIVEIHGGELSVFSNEEKTCFKVKLPLVNRE